jgi:allantoin racemase
MSITPDPRRGDDLRIKHVIPFPLGSDDLALRREQIPEWVRAGGTVVESVPVRNSFAMNAPRAATTYYEWALLEAYVLESGSSAQDEGYDAVVVDTTTDSAVRALRSRLDIPVVGAGMTAYAIALVIGRRFSVITYTGAHRFLVQDSLHSYELRDKCASVRAIGVPPVLEDAPHEAHEEEVERFVAEAERAINEDGADTILVASTTMHKAAAAMAERLPAPVIDPGPIAIALAELLVRTGLRHSKLAYPSPGWIQDELLHALPSAVR